MLWNAIDRGKGVVSGVANVYYSSSGWDLFCGQKLISLVMLMLIND